MSCRETRAGTLALRLARAYSQLPDREVQKLFHALKREGADLPDPTSDEKQEWYARTRILIQHARMSDRQKQTSEQDLFHSLAETHDPATFYALNLVERRARQTAVIQQLGENVTDLALPGSQRDHYLLGKDGRPERVWYASYGSNLSAQRFLTYIEGGRPPGVRTRHIGCRDATPPLDDIAIRYTGALHFACESGRWGGQGIGFLDDTRTSQALGRAYNITSEQFDDVVAQENGGLRKGTPTPLTEVLDKGSLTTASGLYSQLVHIGDYNNMPVVTFTGSFTAQDALVEAYEALPGSRLRNEPSPNYLRMLGRGLDGTFGMTKYQQADYLRGCPGMETYTRRKLLRVLRSPMDKVAPLTRPTFRRPQRLAAFDDAWHNGGTLSTTVGFDTPTYSTSTPHTDAYDTAAMDAAADLWAREASTTYDYGGEWYGDEYIQRRGRKKTCMYCSGPHNMHECPEVG
jgi:hypothetical protein